jgi:hypothetical protein
VIFGTPTISLDVNDASLLGELMRVWESKRFRNLLRTTYYEGKNALKDFGISIPPQLRQAETAMQWVSKGVNALTDRSQFDDFVSPNGSEDPFDLASIVSDNQFMVEFPQAKVSSAIHACSFLTVSQGDVQSGEPEVLVLARAAEDSAALWDRRRRAIRGFLSVLETDEMGQPTSLVMYTPEKVVTLEKKTRQWSVDVVANPLGEVTVAPVVYKPELKRPFGHSRITRAAMYYTDAALRTILRAEASSELYAAPSYWLFGQDVTKMVGTDKWSAVMGRIKALDIDDGEDKPDIHRFEGASPQPHAEQLRMWATLFAGDQGLSVSSLGVVQDNPSSADAIYAAKEDLIIDARNANGTWGQGAVKAMQLAVRLRDGLDSVPDELRRLYANFTDPAIVSPSAAADAFTKRAAAIPGFAETEVGLESAGLTREQIIRFQQEKRRAGVGSLVEQLRARSVVPSDAGVADGVSGAGSGVSTDVDGA